MFDLKKSLLCTALIIGFSMPAYAASDNKASKDEKGYYATGRILVKGKSGLSDNHFINILSKRAAILEEKIGATGITVVKVPPGLEKKIVEDLAGDSSVEFAELDRALEPNFIPNDPSYNSQWHHSVIHSEGGWDLGTADGITIAVLDTGVDGNHPDLAPVMVAGWNSANSTTDTSDIKGHGTQAAGTAAAIFNNGLGVAGVARGAKIMPVRITDDPSGTAYYSKIAAGVTWAADHGAKVVTNSYSGYLSSSVQSAAAYLQSKGGIMFNSAGNQSSICTVPADSRIMVISATNSQDQKTWFSNYGDCVDVAAPGEGIVTTSLGGGYSAPSGTSFSAPMAAGLAALLMGTNKSLSPSQVEAIMKESAYDPEGTDFSPNYGYGRIDVAAAVAMAKQSEPEPKDTTPPTVGITSPAGGTTLGGITSVGVSASDNVGIAKVDLNVNGALYASDASAPFAFTWDTTSLGNANVTLTATAHDAAGNKTTSQGVGITVQNIQEPTPEPTDTVAPVVNFSNPASGAVITSNTNATVIASDNVQVASITLFMDGNQVASSTSSSLSYGLNTKKLSSGDHQLRAVAVDTSGNSSESMISFTVSSGGSTGGGSPGKGRK